MLWENSPIFRSKIIIKVAIKMIAASAPSPHFLHRNSKQKYEEISLGTQLNISQVFDGKYKTWKHECFFHLLWKFARWIKINPINSHNWNDIHWFQVFLFLPESWFLLSFIFSQRRKEMTLEIQILKKLEKIKRWMILVRIVISINIKWSDLNFK